MVHKLSEKNKDSVGAFSNERSSGITYSDVKELLDANILSVQTFGGLAEHLDRSSIEVPFHGSQRPSAIILTRRLGPVVARAKVVIGAGRAMRWHN